jgi:hypothetical protein
MGKKRKRTRMLADERAAVEARSGDLGRRLEEMIERYRELNARKRAEGQA